MSQKMLGVLSLDTVFPRILGDVGNPDSYPFPAQIAVMKNADSSEIVNDCALSEAFLRRLEDAAKSLEADGASAIVSTCGFLITAQNRIAGAVKVPVMLSALSLYRTVYSATDGRIGILTASRAALGPTALGAADIPPDQVVIEGMEDHPAFAATFLATKDTQLVDLDRAAMERAVVRAAQALQAKAPDVRAIILECGNLPPYANAVRNTTGLPVFHLLDAAAWMFAAAGSGTDWHVA